MFASSELLTGKRKIINRSGPCGSVDCVCVDSMGGIRQSLTNEDVLEAESSAC